MHGVSAGPRSLAATWGIQPTCNRLPCRHGRRSQVGIFVSLPLGTEMFHFPRCPSLTYEFSGRYSDLPSEWVAPFGNPRINGCLPPSRGLSQAATSFIGFLCRGIHRLPLVYALTPLKHENVLTDVSMPQTERVSRRPRLTRGRRDNHYPFDLLHWIVNGRPRSAGLHALIARSVGEGNVPVVERTKTAWEVFPKRRATNSRVQAPLGRSFAERISGVFCWSIPPLSTSFASAV